MWTLWLLGANDIVNCSVSNAIQLHLVFIAPPNKKVTQHYALAPASIWMRAKGSWHSPTAVTHYTKIIQIIPEYKLNINKKYRILSLNVWLECTMHTHMASYMKTSARCPGTYAMHCIHIWNYSWWMDFKQETKWIFLWLVIKLLINFMFGWVWAQQRLDAYWKSIFYYVHCGQLTTNATSHLNCCIFVLN